MIGGTISKLNFHLVIIFITEVKIYAWWAPIRKGAGGVIFKLQAFTLTVLIFCRLVESCWRMVFHISLSERLDV